MISEQEFYEQLDQHIEESEKYNNMESFNKLMGTTDYIERISDRNLNFSEDLMEIASLVDLSFVLTGVVILNQNETIFKPSARKPFNQSYASAVMANNLLNVTDSEWDDTISIAYDDTDVMSDGNSRTLRFIKDYMEYFEEYEKIERVLQYIEILLTSDEVKEPVNASTESLEAVLDLFRKYDLTDAKDRKKIYEYWNSTEKTFLSFEGREIEIPLLEKLPSFDITTQNELISLVGEDKESMEILTNMFNMDEPEVTENLKMHREALDKITQLRIPKYTITYNVAPSVEQYENEITLIKLASDFVLKVTGLDTMDYRETFSRNDADRGEVQVREETLYGKEGEVGEDTTTASVDSTQQVGEELLVEVEKVYKITDPLSLLAANKQSGFYINEELAEKLKAKIELELDEVISNPNLRPLVRENYLKQIEIFIEEVKVDFVGDGPYTFAILDDNENKIFLNKLSSSGEKYTFLLQYYEPEVVEHSMVFTLKERNFNSYSSYVDAVNEMATNLFDTIQEVKEIIPESPFNVNKPRGERQRGSAATGLTQGGNYQPMSGFLAESRGDNKDDASLTFDFYEQLVKMVNEYYYEGMDSRFFFYSDRPKFTETSAYKNIASLSIKSGTSMRAGVRRSMVKKKNILLNKKDLDSLNKFFKQLKYYSQLSGAEAVPMFKDIEPIFSNLYTMDIPQGPERRKTITQSTQQITNFMGGLLYKILSTSNKNTAIEYQGKPVEDYKDIKSEITQLNLFDVLEDPTFIEYAKDRKMESSLKELKSTLRNNPLKIKQETGNKEAMHKAYVLALDTLRSSRGDSIYKAYLEIDNVENVEYVLDLIQKEDRIDLYARDIEGISQSKDSFNSISYLYGVSPEVIYKIKGLFR